MSETRRLAAILAADVVGYSRLMGEDEAGTARAVREHREAARPIVASHGGRIVKTTGGTVTRTEFGRAQFAIPSSGSGRGGGSPRPQRFVSEDAERVAGCEMALDVKCVVDSGVNRQEALG